MSPKDDEEIIGFQEFIDSQDEKIPTSKAHLRDPSTDYEVYSFLERDANRLDKMISLFQEQSHVLKHVSQSETLLQECQDERSKAKDYTLELIQKRKSILNRNISKLMFRHFK